MDESSTDPVLLLRVAVDVAELAADHLQGRAGRARVLRTKTSPTDIVTADDTIAEQLVSERLRELRPHDAMLGEELGAREADAEGDAVVRWLVDPIDGTVNYWYGLPAWSISVAAEIEGVVVAGAVLVPPLGRCYTAIRGRGARCNDTPISCSQQADLALALVATGFSYDARQRRRQAASLATLLPAVRDIRRIGSAALDLCLLGAGEVDGYYERGLNEYDRAAGVLVAREAGAVVEVDGDLTWGAPPALAPQLLGLLRAARA